MVAATPATQKPAVDWLTAFVNDVTKGVSDLAQHNSGGAWAAIVLSALLTAYVWYYYGAGAGAPLAASFFICIALAMPSSG